MDLAEHVAIWASRENSVQALVLIGSRARGHRDPVSRPDANSDWDFQIVSSKVDMFNGADWAQTLGLQLRTYSMRRAAIGGVPKVAALFETSEADFVILSAARLKLARFLLRIGFHRHSAWFSRALQDLAVVARPGWRFLKGGAEWDAFYQHVVAEIDDPRLANDDILSLAAGFACDASWILKKIERGELLAAQRMLHRSLAETNFRLLHELKLRRNETTFPDARRAESVLSSEESSLITIDCSPDTAALFAAVDKASETCRLLVDSLIDYA